VAQPDHRESDLTPCSDADREKVGQHVRVTYKDYREATAAGAVTAEAGPQELWWWFLLAVVSLLCGEVWLTRRIVRNR
jgi:hypothetical protein